MHPKAYNLITQLANEFVSVSSTKKLMREHVDISNVYSKSVAVRNSLEKFVKADVALKDVCDSAIKLTSKIIGDRARIKAQKKIIKTTMMSKLIDARKKSKKLKFELDLSKKKLNKVVRKGTLVRIKFMEVVKEETESTWKIEKEKAENEF